MKIAINILKGIELVITAICGVVFGILAPIALITGGEPISEHYILWVWLINSVVCYLVGTIIVMLNFYKVALCFHTLGLAVSIFIYGVFGKTLGNMNLSNPSQLYMPVISLFFVTLAITVIANYKEINRRLTATKEKKYEPAPSVLGGEYTAKKPEKKKQEKANKD